MRAKDRKHFKNKLLQKRLELISLVQKTEDYSREADTDAEGMDLADKASSSYTKELMFSKSDSDRQLLQEVVDALNRIEEGGYGECINCGNAVERKRLEAVPWSPLCLDCQEQAEGAG